MRTRSGFARAIRFFRWREKKFILSRILSTRWAVKSGRGGGSVGVYRNDAAGERKKIWLDISLKTDANFKNMSDIDPIFTSLGIKKDYALMGTPVKQNFFKAVGNSFVYSAKLGGLVLRSLGELLTGKMGLTSMGGPVTTIKATSEAASSGILSFLNISAFIGVNLAVFNLLPTPR